MRFRMARELARGWWLFLLRGVIGVLFGLYAFLAPGLGLAVILGVLAAWLALDGAFSLWHAATGQPALPGAAPGRGGRLWLALEGLLLLASYPASRLERGDLRVTSVSGDLDRLVTPADVAKSKANLPADTSFVVIPGASHASFGAYGPQPGDGTPTIDPVVAQEQVAAAAVALLAAITPEPK
jgi:pimeloyl-ACP methyl ester carboxylesterase